MISMVATGWIMILAVCKKPEENFIAQWSSWRLGTYQEIMQEGCTL